MDIEQILARCDQEIAAILEELNDSSMLAIDAILEETSDSTIRAILEESEDSRE